MRRKGQIAVEYVALIALCTLVVGVGVYNSLFNATSENIIDSVPKYQKGNGAAHQVSLASSTVNGVVGSSTDDFMKQYDIIASDPAGKTCADALSTAMNSISNFKNGSPSDQDLFNIIKALGLAGASNVTQVNANYLVGNACNSLTGDSANAADIISSILDKNVITINYKDPGCSKGCTVASEANSILNNLIPLFNSGDIPITAITSVPNSPVTSVPDVKTTFDDYYYIKSSATDAGYKFMNAIDLITYLYDNNYLPASIKTTYQNYLPKIKDAVTIGIESGSSGGSSNPNWETPPSKVE